MLSDRMVFVLSAYGVSGLALSFLFLWIIIQRRAVKKDLAALEAAGIKRRSDD